MSKRLREMRLSRARARAEKPAAPPDPVEKFAEKAHELAVLKTVEDAATVSAGFWLSYLFVLLYIGIAAGAVTHKDLLLENPVKLPFLNVELPLVAFFVLAPILFIVSHAYTLVHFVMLAAKVGAFDAELKRQRPNPPETREGLRRDLPSNIFVQFLAGPEDIREGGLGLILKAIAWSTLVAGPVLLLLLIQVQFLPYHLEWLTWVHRLAILADVVLLWLLWPAVLNSRSKLMLRLARTGEGWRSRLALTGRYIAGLTACLVTIGLAFAAATFPGEWLDEHAGNKQWIPPNGVTAWLGAKDEHDKPIWTSFHDLLFNGDIDNMTRRRKSLFSNTLVLPHFDVLEAAKIDDPNKLDSVKYSMVLRGRHLESAVFDNADLRKVDLTDAQLWGARLDSARLQGASLESAQLQGASLRLARLQGASLKSAQLQGASLYQAQLPGAVLFGARLQGAALYGAQLQGAALEFAQLQGAALDGVELQGAALGEAPLQGANFKGSTLAGTDMRGAAVWRANFEGAALTAVFADDLKESAISKDDFAALKAMIRKEVPEGEERANALKRIEILNPSISGPETRQQETLQKGRVTEAAYQKALADELNSLACSLDEDAPYILRGLIANHRIEATEAKAAGLVDAILKPECPVSAALTEADKAALKKLAKVASGAH